MPENPNLDMQDFRDYDALATEELEEILRLDALAPADREQDTERLYYIMDLLAQRRQDGGEPEKTAAQAWAEFREHYLPCEQDVPQKPRPTAGHRMGLARRFRSLAAVATVLALLVCITLRADAFGFNYSRFQGTWTDEGFSFSNMDEPDESGTVDPASYTELQRLLVQAGMDPNLAPTWFPEGFEMTNVTIDPLFQQTILTAEFRNGDRSLGFSVETYLPDVTMVAERSEGPTDIIYKDNVIYYLFPNLDTECAIWLKDEWVCNVWGYVTREEMKQIINSIPEGA